MKKFIREKRKLELYLEHLEIEMQNTIDKIRDCKDIDNMYLQEMNNAHELADKLKRTKFEILLLKQILKETKENKNV